MDSAGGGASGIDAFGQSITAPLTWHDFLERMRQPSAADFVKSIKSFIVSFSNKAPDAEKDSVAVQEFLATMEGAFRAHPLWAGSTEEELESAGEGLEKYVMTKLYNRAFASLPEDVKNDEELFEKISLVQKFIRPEMLDIMPTFQNETSWLANPPQLHSNLLYIQRYRRQSRLVSEAAYFFTNILSAESFIWNIDALSLSMDELEYQRNMESARALLLGLSNNSESQGNQTNEESVNLGTTKTRKDLNSFVKEYDLAQQAYDLYKNHDGKDQLVTNRSSLADLEKNGAGDLLKDDQLGRYFLDYPFLYAHTGDLTTEDVENLLNSYKQLVLKYVSLCKGMGINNTSSLTPSTIQMKSVTESIAESRDSAEVVIDKKKDERLTDSRSNETYEGLPNYKFNEKYEGLTNNQSSDSLFLDDGEPKVPADASVSHPIVEKNEVVD